MAIGGRYRNRLNSVCTKGNALPKIKHVNPDYYQEPPRSASMAMFDERREVPLFHTGLDVTDHKSVRYLQKALFRPGRKKRLLPYEYDRLEQAGLQPKLTATFKNLILACRRSNVTRCTLGFLSIKTGRIIGFVADVDQLESGLKDFIRIMLDKKQTQVTCKRHG